MLFLQIRIWMSIHDAIPAQAEPAEKLEKQEPSLIAIKRCKFHLNLLRIPDSFSKY